MELAGIGKWGIPENRFTYNAQSEKQKDLYDGKGYFYETDFRGYDPQLGRFKQYEPLADIFSSISPYQFAFNNPVRFNDPMGLEAGPGIDPIKSKGIQQATSNDIGDAPTPQRVEITPTSPQNETTNQTSDDNTNSVSGNESSDIPFPLPHRYDELPALSQPNTGIPDSPSLRNLKIDNIPSIGFGDKVEELVKVATLLLGAYLIVKSIEVEVLLFVTPYAANYVVKMTGDFEGSDGSNGNVYDPDEIAKRKIIGEPQDTKDPAHALKMLELAVQYAKEDNVEKVFLDKAYKNAFPGSRGPNMPDLMILKNNKVVDIIEIRSEGQTADYLFRINADYLKGGYLQSKGYQAGKITVIDSDGTELLSKYYYE